MKTVSRDIPLSEITIRKYEKPGNIDKRELVKKLCLSIGLLQPGDSRDVIVDILYALLEARKHKKWLKAEDVRSFAVKMRAKKKLSNAGCALSNVRRQILRIRSLYLAEKSRNRYRLVEFSPISAIFSEKVMPYAVEAALSRVKEYFLAVDSCFSEKKKAKTLNIN